MSDFKLAYGVLNLAAQPHPRGIYAGLLNACAGQIVNFWGSEHASISKPIEVEPGYLQGRIVIWIEIDQTEPAILKDRLEEISLVDLKMRLPENVGFNGRVFLYTFRETDHKLFFESLNEFGKRLSPKRAQRILSKLLSPEILGPEASTVDVTVMPSDDSLERVFSIPNLRRLKIHILRPNADDIAGDVAEILAELNEQKAKSQDIVLVAAPGTGGVEPNQRTTKQAKVAATNGHVDGVGRGEDGEHIERSTKQYPKIIEVTGTEFTAVLGSALRIAKEAIFKI